MISEIESPYFFLFIMLALHSIKELEDHLLSTVNSYYLMTLLVSPNSSDEC